MVNSDFTCVYILYTSVFWDLKSTIILMSNFIEFCKADCEMLLDYRVLQI